MFSSYHSQVSSTFPILLANATWQRTHNNQQWWPIINNQNPPIETRKSTTNNNIVKDDIPSTKKHHLITATSNAYNRSSNMSLLKSFFFVCWCVGMYIPKFTFMCTYLHILFATSVIQPTTENWQWNITTLLELIISSYWLCRSIFFLLVHMSNSCHLCQSLLSKFAYLSSHLPVDLPSTHVPVTLCLSSPSAYRHLTFCMLLPSTYVPVILCLFLSDMRLTLHESVFIWLSWIWICIWNQRNFLNFTYIIT